MSPRRDSRLTVALQLGRAPAIGFQVRRFCHYGYPAVIRSETRAPDGEPNPNLLYLTCPYLRKEAARLEDAGFVQELEQLIAADPELQKDLRSAQEEHRREWAAASEAEAAEEKEDAEVAPGPGAVQKHFPAPNIAAAGDATKIKCLHAHLAWYMVHPDYQIGRIIASRLPNLWCPDEKCTKMGKA